MQIKKTGSSNLTQKKTIEKSVAKSKKDVEKS